MVAVRSAKFLRRAFLAWREDRSAQMAASTAYYTVFSLAPLSIIILAIAGMFLEPGEVEAGLFKQVSAFAGKEGVDALRLMLNASKVSGDSGLTSLIGFGVLLLGATGLLTALQDSFNHLWHVHTKKSANSFLIMLAKRAVSLGFLLTLGFLLVVSLAASAGISFFVSQFGQSVPVITLGLPLVDVLVSFVVITLLFSLLFHLLPDVVFPWRHALLGGMIAGSLFLVGKTVFGFYLGHKDILSVYGAAGSIVGLLLWVNYSAQILFFGMECTKLSAMRYPTSVKPKSHAEFTKH